MRCIFLVPLQVSNDTQVLLNSRLDLKGLVDVAVQKASNEGLSIVIKPHPAEKNKDIINYIMSKKKEYSRIYLTNINTFSLIKRSEYVITINSTVGLEAKLLGKDVIVLGEALYQNFDNRRIKSYIIEYLADVDYFAKYEYKKRDYENIIEKYSLQKEILGE